MGSDVPSYSITDSFDADFGVDDSARHQCVPALVRAADDQIFRTYFIDNRGDEGMGTTWAYLDITALGRQEDWEESPQGYPQTAPYQWWHRHDETRGSGCGKGDEPAACGSTLAVLWRIGVVRGGVVV